MALPWLRSKKKREEKNERLNTFCRKEISERKDNAGRKISSHGAHRTRGGARVGADL